MRVLRHTILLAIATILVAGGGVAQAADAPFTREWAKTLRGDIAAVGNTSLSCPAGATCDAARARTSPYSNNDFTMAHVDVDGVAGTFNSSQATVALPAGASLEWAGLYWAADTSAGTGGSAAPTAANRGQVRLRIGAGAYETVTSSQTFTSTPRPTRFRAFADVTSLLGTSGTQAVTVANIQAGTGADRFAGCALLVAYRDPSKPIRRLNVYDGLGTVDATHTFTTTIAPFQTPATGPVTSRVGLVSFEGDDGYATESGKFNGFDMNDALNPVNNFQNSTIESDGAYFTAKNPNYANQLGMDIDAGGGTGTLANSQSSAVMTFTSTQDYYMPSAFFLVSDEGPALNTAAPSMTGTAQDGATLTASPGTWSGTPSITYAYQWQRCDAAGASCADIAGATGPAYTLTAADVDATVRVRVIATNDAGSSAPATSSVSSSVAQEPPSSLAAPALSGTARDEATLTASSGTWDGTGPFGFTYQWQRCDATGNTCVAIPGATSATYTLTDADAGKVVQVVVTASNGAGEASVTSAPTTVVAAAPPANDDAPGVSRSAGGVLTAGDGGWAGTGPFDFGHRWQRCDLLGGNCVDIAGATGETYTLSAADVGHTVRVVVTAENAVGSASAPSAPSAPILHAPPAAVPGGPPAVTGAAVIGRVLTAGTGDWAGDDLGFAYQWQRCDADGTDCEDIAGATDGTYTTTAADEGKAVRVVVTAGNDTAMESRASEPSAPIGAEPAATPISTPAPEGPGAGGGGTPSGGGTPTGGGTPPGGGAPTGVDGIADPAFLAVPGSLVTPARCQQLAGGARYRRVKVRGIGDVRVRAYTSAPGSPVQVTTEAARRKVKRLTYTIDGRPVRAARSGLRGAVLGPEQLRRLGWHRLVATVKGRKGKARKIVIRLKTVPCGTLFTAQRWRTTAGSGLRLRVDALSALRGVAFKVPAKLMPRRGAKPRTIGFARFLLAGGGSVKRSLELGRKPALLGTPRIAYRGGRLTVHELPARAAVAELTLYRVTKLDGATTRKRLRVTARVTREGAAAKGFAQRPRAPR